MNERLTKELESLDFQGVHNHGDLCMVAQHFYNLALEDVNVVVERQKLANISGSKEYLLGWKRGLNSISDLIEELSK